MSQIIHKDKWGFWKFTKYFFYVEDDNGRITEVYVDKKTWTQFNIGDYRDSVYGWFYSYNHGQNYDKVQN